ncbi:MAG: radical SAM protein [Syntrophomonas sp.]
MDKKDIMPFHLFQHQGGHYVINIERMCASAIEETTAEALNMLLAEPELSLSSELAADLEKLRLISGNQPKKVIKTSKEPYPISTIALFLTYACNLKCIYCYEDGIKHENEISLQEETAMQTVDWLMVQSKQEKKLKIIFFGGEPFLNFSLMRKVVEYSEQKANELEKTITFYVTTNGTLFNEEVNTFLKKHNVNVTISIDGTKEIQDKQRPFKNGKGSYDLVATNSHKLLQLLPDTIAHAVIVDETDPLMVNEALMKIGFSKITTGLRSRSLFDEKTKPKSSIELGEIIRMLEKEAEEWLSHTKDRDSKALMLLLRTGNLSTGLLHFLHNIHKQYPCEAGLHYAAVSCEGDVFACHRFIGVDKHKLGSVFSPDLERNIYHIPPEEYIDGCASCFARYYCAGGCKYMNIVYGGSISEPSESFCQLNRSALELAAYVFSLLDHKDIDFLVEHEIFPPKPCLFDFDV